MIAFVYAAVVFLSNIIGAISGLGGGSIIKPFFDLVGYHTISEISFYSSVAVFTMAIVSTLKQLRDGCQLDIRFALYLSIGSILGGILGSEGLSWLLKLGISNAVVLTIQLALTILTLIISYIYAQYFEEKKIQLKRPYGFLIGLILGLLASFLGIGGGPLNVVALMGLFALTLREAAVYSIVTIFFSQLSKLGTILLTQKYVGFDLTILWVIIPSAIAGGYVGAFLSHRLNEKRISVIYRSVIVFILLINFYNIVNLWI